MDQKPGGNTRVTGKINLAPIPMELSGQTGDVIILAVHPSWLSAGPPAATGQEQPLTSEDAPAATNLNATFWPQALGYRCSAKGDGQHRAEAKSGKT